MQSGEKLVDLVGLSDGSVIIQTPPEITTDTHIQSHRTPISVSTASPSDIAAPDLGLVKASYEELKNKLIQYIPAHRHICPRPLSCPVSRAAVHWVSLPPSQLARG